MRREYDFIETGVYTLQRYADLDYTAWYAMAAFIDNSLNAFLNRNEDLLNLDNKFCEVKISFESVDGSEFLNIIDNAGGIAEDDFGYLLTTGKPKQKDGFPFSEFGMGMKTAAFWIGRKIEIETKHYKSDSCYLITIDLEKVNSDKYVFIEEVKPSANLKGYTKIKISNLNRRLSNKTKKIQDSLSSIYRKYIENGDVSISFENIPLEPITYEFLERSDGSPVREDFEIKLENGKSAKGWVAILKKGKTVLSGFSVYRHNRCVQGYPENAWKPKEVFSQEGGSNTRKNQRVVGELDMSDFKVVHTKNRINFIDNEEEEFREKLGQACKKIAQIADGKPQMIVHVDPHEHTLD